jgi:beta-glucosidase
MKKRIRRKIWEGYDMEEQKNNIYMKEFSGLARKAAAEGTVLLKNEDHVLPLQKETVSIFGRTQIDYYRSGIGSGGSVNVPYTTNLLDSMRSNEKITVNEELARLYEAWRVENSFDNGGGRWATQPWYQKEMPLSDEVVKKARMISEKAIIVIGRTAGEDKDNADKEGSYRLASDEKQMLNSVCSQFEKVIVVLNVSNIIDMSWMLEKQYSNSIKAVLYAWQGGQEGGNAVVDALAGEITPSGKLPDTIAYSINDYPSTNNFGGYDYNIYAEDIYVGYRYFETFCKEKVQYEFGFGLSYTNFKVEVLNSTVVTKDDDDYVEVKTKVQNTGKEYSGKEVVQVYVEAPQVNLGKPARFLVAFEKTKLLCPGEEEILLISFPVKYMASFDDEGITGYPHCYVLEEGIYQIHVGTSVRNTVKVTIDNKDAYYVDKLMVVEALEEALAPTKTFNRIKPGFKKEDNTYEIAFTKVPAQTISIHERIQNNLPKAIPQTSNKGIKLRDVYAKKAAMEEFIAQLTTEELATIVRGEGMCSPKVTPGTASAFGGVGDSLLSYGIPLACAADGPSGIRMEGGGLATQVPIGTLLASTWDTKLINQLYIMEGKELKLNQIDTLLGPGMNIHRNPMNGRNFEYFSEDPILTGSISAAIVNGIKTGGSNATIKHFACNSQETRRSLVDAVISERALREIYLKGFEIAVKQGGANSIMTSYNPINGHWSASNYELTTTILRKEWNFEGIVMTDWWAMMNNTVECGPADRKYTDQMIRAQNDLYMVVANDGAEVNVSQDNTLESIENGTLTLGELQRNAMNICSFLMKAPVFFSKQDFKEQIIFIPSNKYFTGNSDCNSETDKKLYVKKDLPLSFTVTEDGVYRIIACMKSYGDNLAQAIYQILLNEQKGTTGQINGTNGNWCVKKLTKVKLEKGMYEVKFHIANEVEIEWIQFILLKS